MNAIIVGLGNPLLQDDGIGPYLVQRLRDEQALSDVEYYLTTESGMYLIEKLIGYDQALIIDSIKSPSIAVGEVVLLTAADFKVQTPVSGHVVDLFSATQIFQMYGVKVPTTLGLIGVGVKSNTIFGEKFSAAIEQRRESIYQQVKNIAREFFSQEARHDE